MGVTWIEASAGTGKTYTLVKMVVEMVRDRGLTVDRILLVTFTEKATAELKTRIRQGLRQAWKATRDERLAQALENLSSLSITTIHGFCRTLLGQFPLESGVSFTPDLVDQGRQWRRALREELRPRLRTLDAALLTWAGLEEEEALLSLARQALDRHLFRIPLLHPTEAEQRIFDRYRQALETHSGPLWDALETGRGLGLPEDPVAGLGAETIGRFLHAKWHQKPYRLARRILAASSFRDLLEFLEPDALESLAKWREGSNLWKKGGTGPLPQPLAELQTVVTAVLDAVETWTSTLPAGVGLGAFLRGAARHELLDTLCRPVLERRSSRELTFDDLIDRVRNLVVSASGEPLRTGAAARWTSVLIDEFQDTDQDQWEIFSGLFGGPDHDLILVGDPKQSIYRFRGADLDVYRSVREQVLSQGARFLVLEENFRSTEDMIEAMNRVFSPASGYPWNHPDDFIPSKKGSVSIPRLVRRQGDRPASPLDPLRIYQDAPEPQWHRHLVHTVLTLLDGTHFLEDDAGTLPLEPGDIMILVRKKREAWTLFRMLTARGIPATVSGSGGLLGGREAQEVLLFLKALEAPRSLSAARALGWTRLFAGGTVDQLAPALDQAQADRDQGAFLRAFRRVAAALEPGVVDGGGLEHLLRRPGGARLVTNAEHVLELVQERYHRGEVPVGQAALSLETWIQSGLQEDEVDLRRDGEARTLRLMTIHAAKGLEAPIVLHGRPGESKPDRQPWIVHRGVDFLLTEDSQTADARNRRDEEGRLRYVAWTRARTHQVFIDPTAAGALPVPEAAPPEPSAEFRPRGLPGLQNAVPALLPAVIGLENRHPWIESHSGLWRRAWRDETAPVTSWDRPLPPRDDETPNPPADDAPQPESLASALPAGAAFGDLVHDVLEQADFRAWSPQASEVQKQVWNELVETHCQRRRASFHGRDWTRPLAQWLQTVLQGSFSLGSEVPPVTLSLLAPEDTRRELEFHLPLGLVTPRSFVWADRTFVVHPGFLTGRIDLLFRWHGRLYLADWKTNRLAPGQGPAEVMADAGYDLQAQWYWEALTRLCRLQGEALIPGGVLYIFLRGAGDEAAGVFRSPGELAQNRGLSAFFQEDSLG